MITLHNYQTPKAPVEYALSFGNPTQLTKPHLLDPVGVSLGVARHADTKVVAVFLANVLHLNNSITTTKKGAGGAQGGGER